MSVIKDKIWFFSNIDYIKPLNIKSIKVILEKDILLSLHGYIEIV